MLSEKEWLLQHVRATLTHLTTMGYLCRNPEYLWLLNLFSKIEWLKLRNEPFLL